MGTLASVGVLRPMPHRKPTVCMQSLASHMNHTLLRRRRPALAKSLSAPSASKKRRSSRLPACSCQSLQAGQTGRHQLCPICLPVLLSKVRTAKMPSQRSGAPGRSSSHKKRPSIHPSSRVDALLTACDPPHEGRHARRHLHGNHTSQLPRSSVIRLSLSHTHLSTRTSPSAESMAAWCCPAANCRMASV